MNRPAIPIAVSARSRYGGQPNPTISASVSGQASIPTWTPSSLAGKALGVFRSKTEQKLRSTCSAFPHDDNTQITNIAEIYIDALGYLSPASRYDSHRKIIIKLFLEQISTGHTRHLQIALLDLPAFEKQHFLSAIVTTCMNNLESVYDTDFRELRHTALSTTTREAKTLVPLLRFIANIATQSDSACRTVLKAGVLDMLLRIYDIFPAFSKSALDAPEHWSPLLEACRSTVLALSQSQRNNDSILSHPLCTIWTDCNPHPPAYTTEPRTPDDALLGRCTAWRAATSLCVKRRMITILTGDHWKSNAYEIEDIEACVDIVEFTRSEYYSAEVVELAFLAMLKQIILIGNSALHLVDAIAQAYPQDLILVFSGVIRLWLQCIQMQAQTQSTYGAGLHMGLLGDNDMHREINLDTTIPMGVDKTFYTREKHRLFQRASNKDSSLYNMIKFAVVSAQRHSKIRSCMLDAGALSLVISAFVNADFLASSLIDVRWERGKLAGAKSKHATHANGQHHAHFPVPSDVILAEASTLSVLIHHPAFRDSWQKQQFNDRRHLCSLLVNLLLGGDAARNDRYGWTRALFSKILA